MRIYGPAAPGVFRTTLAALVITLSVAVALKWEPADRWWIGAGAALLLALLGSWRGTHLSTIVRRRVALTLRNRRSRHGAARSHSNTSNTDVRTTVLLQIGAGPGQGLPLSTIASYLDRYGIRCASIRVTSSDPGRVTWIGLTLSAADNLAALLARSEQIPLHQTAHVVQRRLADHLRELGWDVHLVDASDVPWPLPLRERWRGVQVDRGYLAAYRVTVDNSLPETLTRIWVSPALQTWTVMEFTGDPAQPAVSAGCACLTADKPAVRAPLDGLAPHAGDHGPALAALNPASTEPLHGRRHVAGVHLDELRWPPGGASVGFHDGLDPLQGLSHVPQVAPSA